MRTRTFAPAAAVVALLLGGCAATAPPQQQAPTPAITNGTPTTPPPPITRPPPTTPPEEAAMQPIVGTILRFSAPAGSIDVTIDEDNPAVRDLLSMLPLTLTFEDFAGQEKIAYPPRAIQFAGSPPSSAGAGDLAIYTPWGDIAFFYEGQRGAPSDQIVHLGTFDASREELEVLEGSEVTVDVVE